LGNSQPVLEMHAHGKAGSCFRKCIHAHQRGISLGSWCSCLDQDFNNIVNMVSRKVSLARAALNDRILWPTSLGSWSPFKYASKALLHHMLCQKEETKPCQCHITAARADGKPQPMAGCLETHWRMLMWIYGHFCAGLCAKLNCVGLSIFN